MMVLVPGICHGQDDSVETEVFLDEGLWFTLKDGKQVEINGGVYRMRTAGPDTLRLSSANEDFEIPAEPLELEEDALGTNALSFADEAGVQHVVFAREDGSVLSSIGRKEPAVEQRSALATSYATVDRVKAIAAATAPVRISPKQVTPLSRIRPPKIEVNAPVTGDTWLHGNTYEVRWKSTDGTFAKVGDKVRISLVRSDGMGTGWPLYTSNNGENSAGPNMWDPPGTYRLVVASAANTAIMGQSQPFTIRVTEPCETGGTVISCGTVYLKGFRRSSESYIGPPGPGWARTWITQEPIYSENGGRIATINRLSDGRYWIEMYSGGRERKYKCGGFATCNGRVDGVVSTTIYLHASK